MKKEEMRAKSSEIMANFANFDLYEAVLISSYIEVAMLKALKEKITTEMAQITVSSRTIDISLLTNKILASLDDLTRVLEEGHEQK